MGCGKAVGSAFITLKEQWPEKKGFEDAVRVDSREQGNEEPDRQVGDAEHDGGLVVGAVEGVDQGGA